ncbi:unnamed protein product [Closterium sp. NIES-53]
MASPCSSTRRGPFRPPRLPLSMLLTLLAVRAHLPFTQRAHFCQVTSAQTLYVAVVRHYSSLSPDTQPLRQHRPLLGEVQQLVKEARVGTCTSAPTGGAAGGGGGSGDGQQCQQRQPKTLLPQQLQEWVSRRRVPGGLDATSLGVCEPASIGAAPVEALHTFMLDSGASRCFFRDCTIVTPLTTPVPPTLADSTGGPVVARASTILPCPAAPSGLLAGLYLPSFTMNLVSNAVLQDQSITVTTPGGELVAICTDSRTGAHLATFTWRPGSSLYTMTTGSAPVATSGQVAASCSCRLLRHPSLLWHHRLGHPSLPRLHSMHSRLLVSGLPRSLPPLSRSLAPPCLPCVEGRQRAAPHSSFPPTTAPL